MYRENNKGPRTVPWGTPDKTGAQSDFTPFTTTRCCLKQRKESIHFNVLSPIPYLNNLLLRSSWGGVSNAFSKSNMNVSTCPLLSKILAQSFITVVNWVSQLCPFLNACCLSDRSWSFSYKVDENVNFLWKMSRFSSVYNSKWMNKTFNKLKVKRS